MSTVNNKFSEYDFIAVIDASGSMGDNDTPTGVSRWDFAQETVTAIAREVSKYDSDGIGLVTFGGGNIQAVDGVTVDKVKEVFATRNPMGSTPLAQGLTEALKLAGKSDKKDFIFVLTDGVPDDKAAAAQVIVNAANGQASDDALTILFIQVGKDAGASAYLKSLDDDLKGAKFDIVDAKTIAEVEAFPNITALIEAAING